MPVGSNGWVNNKTAHVDWWSVCMVVICMGFWGMELLPGPCLILQFHKHTKHSSGDVEGGAGQRSEWPTGVEEGTD